MALKRLNDLKKRAAVSLVMILVLVSLIVFSQITLVKIALLTFTVLLGVTGIWEYVQLLRAKDLQPNLSLMVVLSIFVLSALYIGHHAAGMLQLPLLILIFGVIASLIIHLKDHRDALLHVAVELFGVFYIIVPLGLLLAIIYPSSNGLSFIQDGRWWFFYLIVVTKITDVGAFFVGRLWGKTKLATFISPKKTVEGAVAGLVCAVLASVGFYYLGKNYSAGLFNLSFVSSLCLGLLIGILGQLGDLAESMLKRDAVVKDSNKLPGLGGILDTIDSLLFTIPILYFFLFLHS